MVTSKKWMNVQRREQSRSPIPRAATYPSLHRGKMKQVLRAKALESFTSFSIGVLLCENVTSRGFDISWHDCIVQYDQPQNLNDFIHRVGRTARIGKLGRAVFYLLPKEEAYVKFLCIRRISLQQKNCSADAWNITPEIRITAKNGGDVMEKAVRAFVSYVRAYKEHTA